MQRVDGVEIDIEDVQWKLCWVC